MDVSLEQLAAILVAPLLGSLSITMARRIPLREPFVFGRSRCAHCGHSIRARDLVPIVSYIALRGRCRDCGGTISPLEPWAELGMTCLAVWAALATSGWVLWASLVLGTCLITLALMDLQTGILSDVLTGTLLVSGLAFHMALDPVSTIDSALGAIAGFVATAGILETYRTLKGREALGWGDVKLFTAAGAWVMWWGLASVVLLSALFALSGAMAAAAWSKQFDLQAVIPFGPAIAAGLWVVWLHGPLVVAS